MRTRRQFVVAAILLLGPMPAFAHTADTATRSLGWSWDPGIVIPLIVSALLYAFGTARIWRRSGHFDTRSVAAFAAGWTSLVVALNSPLHTLGEQLFWVHMTQHEVLVLVSAPLLVLAKPLVPMLWALPQRWRERLGRLGKSRAVTWTWSLISAPLAAWVLHAIALWVWHAPVLFDLTLHSDFVHSMQHISFFGTGLLFWWALIQGHKAKLGYGSSVAYVFTTAAHTSALGALLTFAPTPWYTPYIPTAASWHLTALQDQQLGGLIMWVPSGTLLTVIGLALLAAWLRQSERRWSYTRTAVLLNQGTGGGHEA